MLSAIVLDDTQVTWYLPTREAMTAVNSTEETNPFASVGQTPTTLGISQRQAQQGAQTTRVRTEERVFVFYLLV